MTAPRFPLRVAPGGRFLEDAAGAPFPVQGDTAWSLIAQLDDAGVARYLDDRRRRGFNTILVNLLEHKFATNAPKTLAGIAPFTTPGAISTPNPAYFDWAHRCIQAALRRGLCVWLAPMYLGAGGGDEGFFAEVKAAGPLALRRYGAFVAGRFGDCPNIVWVIGGDYSVPEPDRWTLTALAEGIRAEAPGALLTAHAGSQGAREAFGDLPWLDIDNTYSYDKALHRPLRADFARTPRKPLVMIETTYEGEHDATPQQIRRQAWWSLLSGACGQFLGNNPMWHFDGPGLFAVKPTWRQALDSVGSRDMARLFRFFARIDWTALRPDDALLREGLGDGVERAAAASTPDGRLALVYLPTPRPVAVAGSWKRARWFDPSAGTYAPANLPGSPPGDSDRVLVLENRRKGPPAPIMGSQNIPGGKGATP